MVSSSPFRSSHWGGGNKSKKIKPDTARLMTGMEKGWLQSRPLLDKVVLIAIEHNLEHHAAASWDGELRELRATFGGKIPA